MITAVGLPRRCGAIIVSIAVIVVCGENTTPTSPDSPPPSVVQLGPQLLQIQHNPATPFCSVPTGTGATLLVARATLSWTGAEWVAKAADAASGDFELHFHESGAALASGVSVSGTIKGTLIHAPDLFQGFPTYTAQVTFGSDNLTTLSGIAAPAGGATNLPIAAVDGTGRGTATLTDGAGLVCLAASFHWTLIPTS